jgi:hypothetical protein
MGVPDLFFGTDAYLAAPACPQAGAVSFGPGQLLFLTRNDAAGCRLPCEPPGPTFAVPGKCLLLQAGNRLSGNGPSAGSTEAVLGGLCRGATRHGCQCELASRWDH